MRVRLLVPFGIYSKGDVIDVRQSVADFWMASRMVEPAPVDKQEVRFACAPPLSQTAAMSSADRRSAE